MAPRTPRSRQMLAEAPAPLPRPHSTAGAAHGRAPPDRGEGWHRRVEEGMPEVRGMAGAARPCPPRPPRCERPPPPGDAGEQRSQPQGLREINRHVNEQNGGGGGAQLSARLARVFPPPRCNAILLFIPAAPGLALAPKPPRERGVVPGWRWRGTGRGGESPAASPTSVSAPSRAGRGGGAGAGTAGTGAALPLLRRLRGMAGHAAVRRRRAPCPALLPHAQ